MRRRRSLTLLFALLTAVLGGANVGVYTSVLITEQQSHNLQRAIGDQRHMHEEWGDVRDARRLAMEAEIKCAREEAANVRCFDCRYKRRPNADVLRVH